MKTLPPKQRSLSAAANSSNPAAVHIWKTRPLLAGTAKLQERILSHLLPVVEIPRFIFLGESRFEHEEEVVEICRGPGPLPFVKKGTKLCSFAPLTRGSALAAALKDGTPSQERFADWLEDPRQSGRAIELLNRSLRRHAWKRGMRFDEVHRLFYFTRSKPKKLWWEIGGKLIQREVTAPNIKWNRAGGGVAEYQCGWKHEAVRAEFAQLDGALFLRLEPAWFLTELDGKTPFTHEPVGPANTRESLRQGNERVLQTLCFWCGVLAKGHRELRINTGANPIRARLTPAVGSSSLMVGQDRGDLSGIPPVDFGDCQLIPELGPIEA